MSRGLENIAIDDLGRIKEKTPQNINAHLSATHLDARALLEITGVPEWDIGLAELLGFPLQSFVDDIILALCELSQNRRSISVSGENTLLRRYARDPNTRKGVVQAINSLCSYCHRNSETKTILVTLLVATLRRIARGNTMSGLKKSTVRIDWDAINQFFPFAQNIRYIPYEHTRDVSLQSGLFAALKSRTAVQIQQALKDTLDVATLKALGL